MCIRDRVTENADHVVEVGEHRPCGRQGHRNGKRRVNQEGLVDLVDGDPNFRLGGERHAVDEQQKENGGAA